MPRAIAFEREKHGSVPDAVAIDFPFGGEARVERIWNEAAPHDPNGRRQDAVQRGNPTRRRVAANRQIHMRALRDRVHARVRPAGAMDAHLCGADLLEGPFEVVLDCISVGLALPSGKGRAVVGYDELQPGRHLVVRPNLRFRIAIPRRLQPVEIALQNHLRRHLVDEASRIPRLLAAFAQGTMRSHCGETLIPGDHFAGKQRTQFFSEGERFTGSLAHTAIHVARQPDDDPLDVFLPHKFSDPLWRFAMRRRDRFNRMGEHAQLIGNRDADSRATEIYAKNAPSDWKRAHCNPLGSLPTRFLIFSA